MSQKLVPSVRESSNHAHSNQKGLITIGKQQFIKIPNRYMHKGFYIPSMFDYERDTAHCYTKIITTLRHQPRMVAATSTFTQAASVHH